MKGVLRFIACFLIIILLFVVGAVYEKQDFLSGIYEEQQGMEHTISFTDDRFCYNGILSGTYTIKGGVITLRYDDGVLEHHDFKKTGDNIGDSLWLDTVCYIKTEEK